MACLLRTRSAKSMKERAKVPKIVGSPGTVAPASVMMFESNEDGDDDTELGDRELQKTTDQSQDDPSS